MTNRLKIIITFSLLVLCVGAMPADEWDAEFVTYVAAPCSIKFYWKNAKGQPFGSINNLKQSLEAQGKELKFATNGGMYKKNHSPVGLYIEANKLIIPIDTLSGTGNFYLKPNGVFYLTMNNTAVITPTDKLKKNDSILFATQSGPMLLADGEIHPAFKKGSANLNIRNGAGILPDGTVVFAMSKKEINFYDFAAYFMSMHCKNALYLDGFVSRTYLPEKNWKQLDGDFGVIGVTD
jgi:uncharacterized protein YigE (DUF2233 family)